MLDRSPCGSGTAAIVASNWSKGQFKIGNDYTFRVYLIKIIWNMQIRIPTWYIPKLILNSHPIVH